MYSPSPSRVVIVGGGIMGSFSAWALRRAGWRGAITVVEPDPSYRHSSTALSAASIRTQFGTPVNVRMSLYGAQWMRQIEREIDAGADIGFREQGYLVLGPGSEIAQRTAAAEMQRAQGAEIELLDADALRARFPGIALDGIAMGSFGARHEGWFDAWSLLSTVRRAAIDQGVVYAATSVTGFETDDARITAVRTADGQRLAADWCVLAAGAWSGRIAAQLGIGLPIVARKRTVFVFKAPFRLDRCPMIFDPSGLWVRPEGEGWIAGIQPPPEEDPDADGDFEPQHALFEERLWPLLAARIPAMEALRLQRAWAGHYEVNTLDHNGVIGPHDGLSNLVFTAGFSGHGVQHAPAAGRGVAEWIVHGGYQTIDLNPLGWPRIARGKPLLETVVY